MRAHMHPEGCPDSAGAGDMAGCRASAVIVRLFALSWWADEQASQVSLGGGLGGLDPTRQASRAEAAGSEEPHHLQPAPIRVQVEKRRAVSSLRGGAEAPLG